MQTQGLSRTAPRTIGISIECDALRLAESRGGRILRCTEYFYPAGTTPESDTFCHFLQDSLQAFTPKASHLPLWVSDGLPGLQAKYLLLPRVTSGSVTDMVYWAFRKDVPFDPAHTLFDYHVEMRTATPDGDKLHVIAYTVPRPEVSNLTALLESVQLPLAGIIIPPFAMHNLLPQDCTMRAGERLLVFAGAEATTLLITLDDRIQSCRVFKTGMHTLLNLVAVHFPAYTQMEAFQYIGVALTTPEPGALELQIREVIERIVQQIELSAAVYMNEHGGHTVEGLYVMGAIAGIAPFAALLEDRLGVTAQHVSLPNVHFSSRGAPADSLSQETLPDRMALAAGAALSQQDHSPNLLCTKQERDNRTKRTHWSAVAVLLAALAVALLHLAHSICEHHNQQWQQRLETQEAQLASFTQLVDQPLLTEMLRDVVADGYKQKSMAAHWLPYAVFRPLLEQTLPDMYLKDISYTAAHGGDTSRRARSPASNSRTKTAMLHLRGVVAGDPTRQRAKLASFAVRLEDTPLLATVRTTNIQEGTEGAADVLTFTMEADLVALSALPPPSAQEDRP